MHSPVSLQEGVKGRSDTDKQGTVTPEARFYAAGFQDERRARATM